MLFFRKTAFWGFFLCVLCALGMPVGAEGTAEPVATGRYTMPLLLVIGAVAVLLTVFALIPAIRKKR